MTREKKEEILKKEFKRWWKKNRVGEKLEEALIFGRTLRFNKKTGKIDTI